MIQSLQFIFVNLSINIQVNSQCMGKKIENYCLESVISEGEFGKVYKATNQKTQQTVAIKVIKIDKYRASPKLEQFTINEIQTLSKIQDTTHIVKFIEILKTANNVYFVYQFCNGGTLESQIKMQGHFSQEKALGYFKDLLKAFKMLVKNNIMHRDIKPSNILLHNGVIKLADFGFCKPLKDARDLSQTMLGSPIYMAPQILKGELYTINADIWSLGVVLYEMLFGYCPFQQRNIARLIDLINSSTALNFPSHIKISKKIEELLKKMLIKDHFKRISWEQLFSYDLSSSTLVQNQKMQRGKSPFMKKHFNSTSSNAVTLSPSQVAGNANFFTRNHYSSKNYQQVKTHGEGLTLHSNNSNNSNNSANQNVGKVPLFKKCQSTNTASSNSEQKYLKPFIEKRNVIKKGIILLHDTLKRSNSKVNVYICCFISKKIKQYVDQLDLQLHKLQADKENYLITGYESRKILGMLNDETFKISNKIAPFQEELKLIKQPKDIVYMRYAEEQGLAQEKQGLIKLLQVDDYLYQTNSIDISYSRMTKKQLREQYEKRVVRND